MEIAEKLAALRAQMDKEGVDGFIVPRADEYQGEYVPASADRLRWISGFTGSAGTVVVLKDRAIVLSDGRYTIQLRQQVDPKLFETADSTITSAAQWIAMNAKEGAVIGYDPKLHTPREIRVFTDKQISMKPLGRNLLDEVWKDRPAAPSAIVELFPMAFAGIPSQEKLDQVGSAIRDKKADAAIIALPDSIAWLLNIRSNDIPHIPVALSYALAQADGTLDWFIDAPRVPEKVRQSFGNRVSIVPPSEIENSIATLRGRKVLLDERRTSMWFVETLNRHGVDYIDAKDPVINLRARKNEVERDSMRRAHIRDGVAVVRLLKWLSEEGASGKHTELGVEEKLLEFRRMAPEFRDTSFDTIAGFGSNGAIVHYRASTETNKTLTKGNLLLLDSGAQYEDGTTDITRTVAIGKPSKEMIERFTLVLKAHIAVATARFPKGTTGAQIDAMARAPLWKAGIDYAHGTGHGVGCYLSVHEEAASLSPRGVDAVEEGMIISNEPGYYKEDAYGIRTENLVLVREDGVCDGTGKPMLYFETLTFAPFDKNLIDKKILTSEEFAWLKAYHKEVYEKIAPHLDKATAKWLKSYI